MRKVLLASAALAIAATGTASADDSQSVNVTATVTATCSMTDPNDVDFGEDPVVNDTETSNFSFTCNFAGDGGEGALQLTFESQNGGLENPDDAEVRDYSVNYNSNGFVLASSLPDNFGDSSGAANVANPRSFDVRLDEALPVAGDYSDVLTVSIAP